MKAQAILRNTFSLGCALTLLMFASFAPSQQTADPSSQASTSPAAFADAIVPPHGVPCRGVIPQYDRAGLDKDAHGSVVITFVVNTSGGIDLALVEQSSSYQKFDDVARNAILKMTCTPYVVDGVAHRVVQHATLNFGPGTVQASSNGTPGQPASSSGEISQEAALRQLGIEPGSAKAILLERWTQRVDNDPDIQRYLGTGTAHQQSASRTMNIRFFSDGELRLTPEQRSTLIQLTMNLLDKAPPDCGGAKHEARLLTHSPQVIDLSDIDAQTYLGVRFDIVKQTALNTPLAQVTEEQRAAGNQAVMRTLRSMLAGDVAAADYVDQTVTNLKDNPPPELWCTDARFLFRAILATPQPYRDWMLLGADTASKAGRAIAHGNARIEAISSPNAAPIVLERVARNVAWPSSPLDVETVVAVRCSPTGRLLSATVSRSSGDDAWDAAVLTAVQAASPFPIQSDGAPQAVFNIMLRSAG
jgi:TonB family protein